MRVPARECTLTNGTDDGVTEWKEVREGPPFVDLVVHSMHAQWGRPVFLWVAPEVSVPLVIGEYRVFAQFDIEAFFRLAEQHGIKMTWVTGKMAEELKRLKISEVIPGSPGARGVKVLMPDGTTQTLLSGFIARVIADLTTPRQLLELVNRGPAQAEKMGVTPE